MDASKSSRRTWPRAFTLSLCFCALAACRADEAEVGALFDAGKQRGARCGEAPDAGANEQVGAAGALVPRPVFCDRPGADPVRDVFCAEERRPIGGLRALQDLLGLSPSPLEDARSSFDGGLPEGYGRLDSVVMLGHSTALSGHQVSPINPRALLLGKKLVMAFQRGVQQIELAARAHDSGRFNFYLLSFRQACNAREGGCLPGDLYTPRVESDWTEAELRDDEELKNTASDCRQCHRRGRDEPLLLMRELEGPWTHFFSLDSEGAPAAKLPEPTGQDLVQDYLQAKDAEAYGQIPVEMIRRTIGLALENFVDPLQPLVFDGETIFKERWPTGPDGWAAQPQRSAAWDGAYEAFKRGEQLALPHYDPRPTDPDKQARLSDAYQRYLAGELAADELPDLADIFPDEPVLRAEIGLQNEPDASAADALIQTCGSCHNDVLDQSISRARFNVALARMDREQRELAIERLSLARGDPGVMPPPEARQLDPDARARLIAYLREDGRSADDDARLEHAARYGMAGAPPP